MIPWKLSERIAYSALVAVLFCFAAGATLRAAGPEQQERRFTVKNRPVVVLQNIVNGRIEVKSWRNPEIVVTSTFAPARLTSKSSKLGIASISTPAPLRPLRNPMIMKLISS